MEEQKDTEFNKIPSKVESEVFWKCGKCGHWVKNKPHIPEECEINMVKDMMEE